MALKQKKLTAYNQAPVIRLIIFLAFSEELRSSPPPPVKLEEVPIICMAIVKYELFKQGAFELLFYK